MTRHVMSVAALIDYPIGWMNQTHFGEAEAVRMPLFLTAGVLAGTGPFGLVMVSQIDLASVGNNLLPLAVMTAGCGADS